MSKELYYEIFNSLTGESYGFCTKEERYTTELARKYPLIFKPIKPEKERNKK